MAAEGISEKMAAEGNSFPGCGPKLLSALAESLRFVAPPPAAAHIFHNIATLGGSLENKLSMSVETHKKIVSVSTKTKDGGKRRGDQDQRGKFPTVSNAGDSGSQWLIAHLHILGLEPTGDGGCANTEGDTSRVQLTQKTNTQSRIIVNFQVIQQN